jgi:hypothetical protein
MPPNLTIGQIEMLLFQKRQEEASRAVCAACIDCAAILAMDPPSYAADRRTRACRLGPTRATPTPPSTRVQRLSTNDK